MLISQHLDSRSRLLSVEARMFAPLLALGLLASSLGAQRSSATDYCDRINVRSGAHDGSSSNTHVVMHRADDRDGMVSLQMSVPGRCIEARIIGRVVFSEDDREIIRMDDDAI